MSSRRQDYYSTGKDGSYDWAKGPRQGAAPLPPQPVEPYGSRAPRTTIVAPGGDQSGQQSALQNHAVPSPGRGSVSQSVFLPAHYRHAATPQASGHYGLEAPHALTSGGGQPAPPGSGPSHLLPQTRDPSCAQTRPGGWAFNQYPHSSSSPLSPTAHPQSIQSRNTQSSQGTAGTSGAAILKAVSNPGYPARTSSIPSQSSRKTGFSGTSAAYGDAHENYASNSPFPQQRIQATSTQASSAHAAGKQRIQGPTGQVRSSGTELSSPGNRNEDAELAQAMHASRISAAHQNKSGTSSRDADARTSLTAAKSLSPPKSSKSSSRTGKADTPLEKDFKHIPFHTGRFFTVGRVFMMFHIENAGETRPNCPLDSSYFSVVAHDQVAHHQFRRFVIVEAKNEQQFCYCCPITTYNGRATTKPKVDQRAHAIVYAGQTVPQKLEGENRMVKDALRVVLTSKEERLDAKSRIDFGRVYPIGHNVKVKPIGKIHEDSMPKLKDYYNLEKNRQ